MSLIEEYLKLAEICALTDYADKNSVKRHNKSVKRMYEIVEKIGCKQTTETLDDLTKLLDIDIHRTNIWAAFQLLDRISVDKSIEQKALNIIKPLAEGDSAEAMGTKIWLNNYKVRK